MWEWREERGRWQLDDSGSWNWDEPSLLDRVGSAPLGAAGPRRPAPGRSMPPGPAASGPPVSGPRTPPVPPPGPWAPPEPWRRGPVIPSGPAGWSEPRDLRDARDLRDEPWLSDAGWALAEVIPAAANPTGEIPSEETPIFAAVAEDHEHDETTGGQRLRPSRHGVPEDGGHPGVDDRLEYRTAPWIPEPSPGSGPFPVPGGLSQEERGVAGGVPAARHARGDGPDRPDDAFERLDGRHSLRR